MGANTKPLVLVVDDTPHNLQVLGSALYDNGYNVIIATSGAGALQSLKSSIPDLILLDIQMPVMDGFEVCARIKESSATKDIPVIFLTAVTETSYILKGFKSGAVDYITKPFNTAELTARVATHIALKDAKERIEKEKEKAEMLYSSLQLANEKLNNAYNDITASINYSKRIQNNMLPSLDFLDEKGIRHFLIYRPKDIIGGDFYWVNHIGEKIFIAVADCTGHGVPGALLSILGHNLLFQTVNMENITDPAEILNYLNRKFRSILKQEITSSNDGMDIFLCAYNIKTNDLEYAGARRPALFCHNKRSTELIPDRLSIGGQENSKSVFTKKTMKISGGGRLYMFTDGITDQFDHDNKHKITRKRLEYHLSSLSGKSFGAVKKDLLNYLNKWQGGNAQTDDILMLGIEFS